MNKTQQKLNEAAAGPLAPILKNVPAHLVSFANLFMQSVVTDPDIPKHRRKHYLRMFTVYGAMHSLLSPDLWF